MVDKTNYPIKLQWLTLTTNLAIVLLNGEDRKAQWALPFFVSFSPFFGKTNFMRIIWMESYK